MYRIFVEREAVQAQEYRVVALVVRYRMMDQRRLAGEVWKFVWLSISLGMMCRFPGKIESGLHHVFGRRTYKFLLF